jgi:hypothetical protein
VHSLGDQKNLDLSERSDEILSVVPEKAEGAPCAERRNFARSRAKKKDGKKKEKQNQLRATMDLVAGMQNLLDERYC